MKLQTFTILAMCTLFAASTEAQQLECNDAHIDGVGCFKRWDIKGFYYADGVSLTDKTANIATELLPSADLVIQSDPDQFPPAAKLLNAYVFWSGSLETPDANIVLTAPGTGPNPIVADKCYTDDDNRVGSISKNFYTCRADIMGVLKGADSHFGTYTVGGVDAVILPGGNACNTTKECYEEASKAAGKLYTSCTDNGTEICKCEEGGTCSYGQSTIGHASFSLVFVYEHGDQTRSVFLYDGMEAFIAQTVDFDLTNLKTPNTPDNQGQLTYYIVEGDNDDVAPHPFVPPELEKKNIDNPGEKVTLQWGTDAAFDDPFELESTENPIWDDPFNGTTGAGVDIESFDLPVPANRTKAALIVHSPNIDSVEEYGDETCTDPALNNNCGPFHQCACVLQDPNTDTCAKYGCIDSFANDGIGVAYVVVGFDAFSPSFTGVAKTASIKSNAGGSAFNGDINGDGEVSPGEQIQFSVTGTNEGSAAATNVKFVDPLPGELVFAGFGGDPLKVYAQYEGNVKSPGKSKLYTAVATAEAVTVDLEDVEIGETVTVYLNCIINPGYPWDELGKVIFNQARFEADFIDPVVTDWGDKPGNEDPTEIAVLITDVDDDGFADHIDNCPTVSNPDQADTDEDGQGDVCDDDIDNDGVKNDDDSCPFDEKYWLPEDAAFCADADKDGIPDAEDNCPNVANEDQGNDFDDDGIGDECDDDGDNDGLSDDEEAQLGTDPKDADTDDDGVTDGEEVKGYKPKNQGDDAPLVTGMNPLDCDTDNDGLPDGLEVGIPQKAKHPNTKECPPGPSACSDACHFTADKDSSTTTDPTLADTDGGGVPDGEEDINGDGAFNKNQGELDPLDASDDRILAGGSTLISCTSGDEGSTPALALVLVALLAMALIRSRRRTLLLGLAILCMAVLPPMDAAAQTGATTEVNYNPFRFAGNSKGIILTEGGALEAPLDWNLALGMHFGAQPVTQRNGLNPNEIIGDNPVDVRVEADLQFAIGLASWFEVDLYIPTILHQEGSNPDPLSVATIQSAALGDITLTPKLRIAGSKYGGGFLTLLLPVTFPTGKATGAAFSSEPNFGFRPTLAMSAGDNVKWAMNLGAVIRERTNEAAVKNNMEFQFSTGFAFSFIRDTSFLLWDIYGNTQFDDFFGSETSLQNTTGLETLLGYKHRFRKIYATLGGGLGILGGRGVPQWRVFLLVNYATELLDRDGDGISDDDDMCPEDPEDFDKWQDTDGCPDPDNDNDGILDARDDCPNEPEDVDGFQDADGCPETDNDKDGILDAVDKCPLQPEDKDGWEDEDGCPEPDNDRDGILDTADKCPNKPEDKDGFEDEDGCPELDNDKDGIVDAKDTCPNEPENFNGYKDEDGCPDVVFTCKEFKIPEKIFFKTGSARIQKQSFPLLDVVAETFIKHPEAALTEVQGHTDKRGSRRYNTRLSDRRAGSVVKYLIKRGVPADRLAGKGYGPDKPLEEGKVGKEYYDQNRRVQFIVLKLDSTKSKNCQK